MLRNERNDRDPEMHIASQYIRIRKWNLPIPKTGARGNKRKAVSVRFILWQKMTAKEYLSEIRRMRHRLLSLKRREEEVRTAAEGLRAILYDKDKVQTSVTNKTSDIIVELVSVQEAYVQAMLECMKGIAEREKLIASLPYDQAEVLRMMYVEEERMTWRDIAARMGYNTRTVQRYHAEGLKAIENKMSHFVAPICDKMPV